LSIVVKPFSLVVDGMAPFAVVPILLVDWLSSPHCLPTSKVSPQPFDLQPLLPISSLLQEFVLCQHCWNLIFFDSYFYNLVHNIGCCNRLINICNMLTIIPLLR
jgi:hypothetical protein